MEVTTSYELDRFNSFYTKEPETISWIEKLVKPGDVFYDIGANVGVFSLFARAIHGTSIKVMAFEPCYYNFDKLCLNVLANGFSGSITPLCIALSDKTEFNFLNVISNISGSSGHSVGSARKQLGGNFKPEFKQGIFVVSLDEAVEKFGLSKPNHIKIDTDGFEEKILRGGRNVFKNQGLRSVLVEITDIGGARIRIEKFMTSRGFNMTHPINFQEDHSRKRREENGKGMISNTIFTRN